MVDTSTKKTKAAVVLKPTVISRLEAAPKTIFPPPATRRPAIVGEISTLIVRLVLEKIYAVSFTPGAPEGLQLEPTLQAPPVAPIHVLVV